MRRLQTVTENLPRIIKKYYFTSTIRQTNTFVSNIVPQLYLHLAVRESYVRSM